MTDAERLAHLRAAMDKAQARLMDMRTILGWDAAPFQEGYSTVVQAQTVAGDAWRILDKAMKETA